MKTLQAVAIDNQIKLLNDYDYVELTILVPRGNIQRMIELTKCIVLSKKSAKVDFNHHAGQLFKTTISVRWGNICKYFTHTISPGLCDNGNIYNQLRINSNWDKITNTSKLPLYSFGQPILRHKEGCSNGVYQNITNQRISLNNTFNKYVKFKNQWFRLVAIK